MMALTGWCWARNSVGAILPCCGLIARYMKQIRFGISEQTIADTLSRYIDISARLVQFFHSRFDLRNKTPDQRQSALEKQQQQLIGALESVAQLNEERTIRRYIELINATLRTNFYQLDEQGNNKPTLAFKLNPAAISDMPLPRPGGGNFLCVVRPGLKGCICAVAGWPVAACAGPTGPMISVPKYWGW